VTESVVLVHGIWLTGLSCVPLRSRLRSAGFDVRLFSYPSLALTPAQSAARLRQGLRHVEGDVVHLVGHSLGGVVLMHLLAGRPPERPGRVVLLGSPVRGSAVARVLAARVLSRSILGRSTERGLLGDAPAWGGGRDLGVVAGTMPVGLGRAVCDLPEPHDGTVAVAETEVDGATDRWLVPVSHTGLLFSPVVARGVAAFLHAGRFPVGSTGPHR
jgi:pimeloyl-ACP methyl ester carboxylesterase